MTPWLAEQFSEGLHRLQSPDQVAKQIVSAILSNNGDQGGATFTAVQQDINTNLSQIGDLSRALEVLLVSLELDGGIVAHSHDVRPHVTILYVDKSGIEYLRREFQHWSKYIIS